MFFLLRCAFWLGLVFLHMDWKIEEPILPSAADLAGQATQQCLANPQACAKIVTTAQQVYTASITLEPEPRPAPVAAAPAPKAPQPAKAAPKVASVKTSADSLRVDDRAPTWQGHH